MVSTNDWDCTAGNPLDCKRDDRLVKIGALEYPCYMVRNWLFVTHRFQKPLELCEALIRINDGSRGSA